MFQPQWYPKEKKKVGIKKKKEKKGRFNLFFFLSRHLIYSVILMLINNA